MRDTQKEAILSALNAPNGCEGSLDRDEPIGRHGAWWNWLRDGEFGTPPIIISDDEATAAINELIREGKINIKVRKDELQLQLPT